MSAPGVVTVAEDSPVPVPEEAMDADYVHRLQRLVDAIQELSLARSLADVQRIVRTAARQLTRCDGATFVLRDHDMCFYADEDAIAPLWKGSRFPIESCISGWAMLNRQSVVIPDIYTDSRIPYQAYRPTFVKSLAMVPIRTLAPVGAIGNYWATGHVPSAREVSLLQALADSTSVAMENIRLYDDLEQRVKDRTADLERANEEIRQLSVTDELTGLNNRRGFYLLADPALSAARRDGRRCLLAFLDIDGLKKVNDERGHDIGDALIAAVGQVLRGVVRSSDILARIGGDEFCVLITDPVMMPNVLRRRLMQAFDGFNATSGRPFQLSASIGLVECPPADKTAIDELLAHADELMYVEKKAKPQVAG